MKAELRLHVVVQRVASANATQQGTKAGGKGQHRVSLLVGLGEAMLLLLNGQARSHLSTRTSTRCLLHARVRRARRTCGDEHRPALSKVVRKWWRGTEADHSFL